ncbi:hypothetical protein GMORB2_5754 [Geosmithia morbida]|uniref:Uncharacterized protein n=1 Tax=Geosmithia morbida TaxID=1094350 RepID=A0A9P5D1L2_9HYPO|nr:uncharacterized protein GMORB2_5754 [Geosmithia morbida]KAF4124038.1 hypothetical protein GMORB2_5754 [Geosmithia morbida]
MASGCWLCGPRNQRSLLPCLGHEPRVRADIQGVFSGLWAGRYSAYPSPVATRPVQSAGTCHVTSRSFDLTTWLVLRS